MKEISQAHPASLRVFFGTEMWERYGFYVVQTLLTLYLALHFHWRDKNVYALVGSFTALTYVSPIIGGWIADHLIGQKRAILSGAAVLLLSYIGVSFVSTDEGLTATLAGIAVGTGLLKPNISSLLGNAYPVGSPNRENGFTIFYMGITTGIILGTTIPSYLNYYFGWSISFVSAAVGMLLAIGVFSFGIYRYHIEDYHRYEYQLKKILMAILLMLLLWRAAFYILNYPALANIVFISAVVMSVCYLLYRISCEKGAQARQTTVILLLCIISVFFWAFYFQMFLSFTLFIARVVKPQLFNIHFPPPYYVGIQSFGMIFFGILLSRSPNQQKQSQQTVRIGNKFVLAMLFMTGAFAILVLVCKYTSPLVGLSPLFIIPAYLMISIAELLLSPVGLAAITMLASPNKVSTMMGIFFVSLGIGAFLAGKLASLTAAMNTEMSIVEMKAHYAASFSQLLVILGFATAVCVVLNLLIKYLMTRTDHK